MARLRTHRRGEPTRSTEQLDLFGRESDCVRPPSRRHAWTRHAARPNHSRPLAYSSWRMGARAVRNPTLVSTSFATNGDARGSWASSPAVRRTMQGNRSRDTAPEVRLRSALHRAGFRFFKNRRPQQSSSCRVDILFPRPRLAVFVDGCFWHGCPQHGTQPRVNAEWWNAKLERNRARDQRNDIELEQSGWRVLRIWEHETVGEAVRQVQHALAVAASSHPLPAPQASLAPADA
jgi:DNA mismatch endonuclease, patch repair protein